MIIGIGGTIMKMNEVNRDILEEIDKLLKKNPATTIVEAALQGEMGEVYYVFQEQLKSVMLKVGDFIIMEGEINERAEEYLEHMQTHCEIISSEEKWYEYILSRWGEGTINKRTIFSSKDIKSEHLTNIIENIPEGCRVERIDSIMANRLLKDRWSRDLILNFNTGEAFYQKGIGFVLVNGLKMVAGASSFSRLKDGIEVEINTNPEHRKMGYGTIVAAVLVKYCLDNNLVPYWNSMNPICCKIATKLGFKKEKDYKILVLE